MDIDIMWLIILLVILIISGIVVFFQVKNKKNKDINNIIGFDIDDLINELGNRDNIIEVKSSISKISVIVKNIDIINTDNLSKFNASGMVMTSNSITLIFGSLSKDIALEMNNKLKR